MFALRLPLLALLAASVHSHLGLLGPKNVSQKDAEFEHLYVDEVNSELVNIYTFNHTVTRNRVRADPTAAPRADPLPSPQPRAWRPALPLPPGFLASSHRPGSEVVWTPAPR